MDKKLEVLETREALIEMYKAGFLDGYSIKNKLNDDDQWKQMNRFYKLKFAKRFAKRIDKAIKKLE